MKLLVILGPTATGKTDLAFLLARKFNGELVSCDSRQVYVGLDIGSGKLPSGNWKLETGSWKRGKGYWEIGGIRVWMYDVVDPKKQYDVSKYITKAEKVLGKIIKRRKLPIIVGGTGFYLKGLLYGFSNLGIPVNKKLRKDLEKLSPQELQKKLQELSKDKWNSLNLSDQQNPRRLIRAIELEINSERRFKIYDLRFKNFSALKIGLTAPRDILYKKVDERVVERIDQGMVEEAKWLHKKGLSLERMRKLGLEYGVLADYLEDKIKGVDILIKTLQQKIHGYVRRQLTWFKKEKRVFWFDITDEKYPENVEKRVSKWYHQTDDTKNRHFS